MLKEICITPQVFDEKQLVNDNSSWKDIKNLLESVYLSGYIIGLNNNDWVKAVRTEISKIANQRIKDVFNNLISDLKDRNRIVGHPKSDTKPSNEEGWLSIAEEIDSLQKVYSILATKKYFDNVTTINQLEYMNIAEIFGITGTKHYVKTSEELKRIFSPLLAYARKVTIIDPYFNISEPRYKITLDLVAKYFKNKRGIRDSGTIYIHCSSKATINPKWKKVINEVFQKYGHIVIINVWDRKTDEIKLHERYIITDQAGIVSGAGTDKDDYQQSEWGIKEYGSLNEILRQYKENSSPFRLKAVIDKTSIEDR